MGEIYCSIPTTGCAARHLLCNSNIKSLVKEPIAAPTIVTSKAVSRLSAIFLTGRASCDTEDEF